MAIPLLFTILFRHLLKILYPMKYHQTIKKFYALSPLITTFLTRLRLNKEQHAYISHFERYNIDEINIP